MTPPFLTGVGGQLYDTVVMLDSWFDAGLMG